MIDTIAVKYEIQEELDEITLSRLTNEKVILNEHSDYYPGNCNLVIRPFNSRTSTITETLEAKERVDKIMCESGNLNRLDMALDSKEEFSINFEVYQLFLCGLSYVRNQKLDKIFNTKIIDFTKAEIRNGNLKVKHGNKITTIYNCSDKVKRNCNTRIEKPLS